MFHFILIITSLVGLYLAFHIHHKKRLQKKLICPFSFDCDAVIHSDYSKFLKVPVEVLGILYYGSIAAFYTWLLALPGFFSPRIVLVVFFLSIFAFLFSVYLTFIQTVVLKQWCTWCFLSAGLCAIILITLLFAPNINLSFLMSQDHKLILIFHVLGVVLGLGGATIADILFFNFLKDFKISKTEAEVLKILSNIIWLSLAVLLVSGLGLYLPSADKLNSSSKFLVKMVVVSVIIINGTLLNLIISPKLVKMSFIDSLENGWSKMRRFRKLAFALGAVSIISWYSAFILGMFKSVPLSFSALLAIYFLVICFAVVASQFFEKSLRKKAMNN